MKKTYPKKRFGQNFLTDKNIARKIVRAIDSPHPQLVIEIGPGRGILTEVVLDQVEKYIGVEIDYTLSEVLQERFSAYPDFTLIQKDFLEFDLSELTNDYADYSRIILGNDLSTAFNSFLLNRPLIPSVTQTLPSLRLLPKAKALGMFN